MSTCPFLSRLQKPRTCPSPSATKQVLWSMRFFQDSRDAGDGSAGAQAYLRLCEEVPEPVQSAADRAAEMDEATM